MTTIAYRDGILAADSRVTNGSGWIKSNSFAKLRRLRDGRLMALAGKLADLEPFAVWLNTGKGAHNLDSESTVVVVELDGRVRVYEGNGHFISSAPFAAWGSGTAPALGAMHAGANAIMAVWAAMQVDNCSGGPVRWLRLSKKLRPTRRASSVNTCIQQ